MTLIAQNIDLAMIVLKT